MAAPIRDAHGERDRRALASSARPSGGDGGRPASVLPIRRSRPRRSRPISRPPRWREASVATPRPQTKAPPEGRPTRRRSPARAGRPERAGPGAVRGPGLETADPAADPDPPDLTMPDGYLVQQGVVRRYLDDGDRIVGYKLGLTSKPMQQMLGVDSPDFAPVHGLARARRRRGDRPRPTTSRPSSRPRSPCVLGATLSGPDCTALDVAARHRGRRRGDRARRQPDRGLEDQAARHGGRHGLAADRSSLSGRSVPLAGLDLRPARHGVHPRRRGDRHRCRRRGARQPGRRGRVAGAHPAPRSAHSLPAGSIVMTGALHAAVPVAAGRDLPRRVRPARARHRPDRLKA